MAQQLYYLEDLRYHVETPLHSVTGELQFNVTPSSLARLGFPVTNFMVTSEDIVFVTAADDSHLHEVMDAIAVFQQVFPTRVVYYYDLNEPPSRPSHAGKVSAALRVSIFC